MRSAKEGLRLIRMLFHPQNGGLKIVAAISSCKKKERGEGERKQSFFKGKCCGKCTFFFLAESIGKNLDTWPVILLREAAKCSFNLSGYVTS